MTSLLCSFVNQFNNFFDQLILILKRVTLRRAACSLIPGLRSRTFERRTIWRAFLPQQPDLGRQELPLSFKIFLLSQGTNLTRKAKLLLLQSEAFFQQLTPNGVIFFHFTSFFGPSQNGKHRSKPKSQHLLLQMNRPEQAISRL